MDVPMDQPEAVKCVQRESRLQQPTGRIPVGPDASRRGDARPLHVIADDVAPVRSVGYPADGILHDGRSNHGNDQGARSLRVGETETRSQMGRAGGLGPVPAQLLEFAQIQA